MRSTGACSDAPCASRPGHAPNPRLSAPHLTGVAGHVAGGVGVIRFCRHDLAGHRGYVATVVCRTTSPRSVHRLRRTYPAPNAGRRILRLIILDHQSGLDLRGESSHATVWMEGHLHEMRHRHTSVRRPPAPPGLAPLRMDRVRLGLVIVNAIFKERPLPFRPIPE